MIHVRAKSASAARNLVVRAESAVRASRRRRADATAIRGPLWGYPNFIKGFSKSQKIARASRCGSPKKTGGRTILKIA
jgi:hypothetical protein